MIFSGGGFIDALLIIGLPNGPTAHFKLSKLVLRKDIKVSCFFCQKLYVYLFSNMASVNLQVTSVICMSSQDLNCHV